jgi:hypothetical protein
MRVLGIVIVLLGIHIFMFVHTISLTGFSVSSFKEESVSYLHSLEKPRIYFLIIEGAALLLLLLMSAAHDLMGAKKKDSYAFYNPSYNTTDLDVLYETLKKEKKISVSKIAKTFKIANDIAFEWCKILESGDLAEIVYPGFGEPLIKIKEGAPENSEKEKEEKQLQAKPEKQPIQKKTKNNSPLPLSIRKMFARKKKIKKQRRR